MNVRGVFARVNALISAIDSAKQELYPNSIRAIDFARPERFELPTLRFEA